MRERYWKCLPRRCSPRLGAEACHLTARWGHLSAGAKRPGRCADGPWLPVGPQYRGHWAITGYSLSARTPPGSRCRPRLAVVAMAPWLPDGPQYRGHWATNRLLSVRTRPAAGLTATYRRIVQHGPTTADQVLRPRSASRSRCTLLRSRRDLLRRSPKKLRRSATATPWGEVQDHRLLGHDRSDPLIRLTRRRADIGFTLFGHMAIARSACAVIVATGYTGLALIAAPSTTCRPGGRWAH